MQIFNNQAFSTVDADRDGWSGGSCAATYKSGGWWFDNCFLANLNGGPYMKGCNAPFEQGIVWTGDRGFTYSYEFSEMKLRPSGSALQNTTANNWCNTTSNACMKSK